MLPFYATNAFEAFRVSLPGSGGSGNDGSDDLAAVLEELGVTFVREDDAAFEARVEAEQPYSAVTAADRAADLAGGFPLPGQFVSLLLCVGHIKSTVPDDDEFVAHFQPSPKWLQLRTHA